MHALAEVVIPPKFRPNLTDAVGQVMEHFLRPEYDGDGEETDRENWKADWWDWWKIGGRWSGEKTLARVDKDRLSEFYKELSKQKVTVSGLVMGRKELQPAAQIPKVDALWREWFPGHGDRCPVFQHAYQARLKTGGLIDYFDHDVCTVGELPERYTCERLLISGERADEPGKLYAVRHLAKEYWNGVEHQDTKFDGKVKKALDDMIRKAARKKSGKEDYKIGDVRRAGLANDWLCVTVDYHN